MRWPGTFAPGSFAQLVALQLLELLHPVGQLPVEAGDVDVVVHMGAGCAEATQISLPATPQQPRVCKILEGGATAPRTRGGVHFL